MKVKILLLSFGFFCTWRANAQTYIHDINIIDVITKRVIPHQTVLIEKNIISQILPGKEVKIPSQTKVFNGEGMFLMPGMTDTHIHFFQSGGLL